MSCKSTLGSFINQPDDDAKNKDAGIHGVIANANKLLVKQTKILECGEQCVNDKRLAQLRDIYDGKKDNLDTAPMQLEKARKNYMEFKYGADDYVTKASVALKKEADVVIAEMTQAWTEENDLVTDLIADYGSMVTTNANLINYLDRVTASVGRLDKNYSAKTNDTITNDRKAYYQNQGIDNLRYWFYLLRWVYGAIVITYIVGLMSFPTTATPKMKFGVLALLVVYPFVVAVIAVASFALIRSLLSKLPYNAFTMGLGVYNPALNSSTQEYNPGSVEAAAISNANPHPAGSGETVAQYLGQYHPAT